MLINKNKKKILINRKAAGTYIKGKWVDGADLKVIKTTAIVLPASGTDIQNLKEGQRTKEVKAVYADIDMYTAREADNIPADVITISGLKYKVEIVKKYDTVSLGHTKAICVREDK